MQSDFIFVILSALSIAVFWGVAPVVYRYMMNQGDVPSYIILIISCIVYTLMVMVYVITTKKLNQIATDISKTTWSKVIIIVITSLLALSVSNLLYLYAIKYTTNTTLITAITSLYPVITLIAAWFILKEKINNSFFFIGLVMVMIGLWIMIKASKTNAPTYNP